jgi:hypothetical protein
LNETLKAILEDWAFKNEQIKALQADNERARIALRERLIQIETLRERLGAGTVEAVPSNAEREAILAEWQAREEAARIRATQAGAK